MKLSFRQDQRQRSGDASATRPVIEADPGGASATRTATRLAPREQIETAPALPWIRWALIAASLLLAVVVVWQLLTMGRIHTYGLVRSQTQDLTAPGRATVGGLYVQHGDQVRAGDTLYMLIAPEAQREADRIQGLIAEEEITLVELQDRLEQLRASPQVDSLQNIQAVHERSQRLERRLLELDQTYRSDSHRLLRDIQLAQYRLAQRQAAAEGAERRSATMELLARLEAATSDDRARQEEAERQAAEELRLQRAELTKLEGALAARTQEYERERTRLREELTELHRFRDELRASVKAERDRSELATLSAIERSQARLESLRTDYDHYKQLAGPTAVRAAADGVITAVAAADGADLAPGAPIMTLSHTGAVWVDVFIPTEHAQAIDADSAVRVERLDGGQDLRGSLARSGAIETGVPAEIQAIDPGLRRATRLRVDITAVDHDLHPGNIVEVVIRL
ncbi:MAG: HlyD family efflux transporter periplasmic adaptor subunit [Planctomycetota bacterium]